MTHHSGFHACTCPFRSARASVAHQTRLPEFTGCALNEPTRGHRSCGCGDPDLVVGGQVRVLGRPPYGVVGDERVTVAERESAPLPARISISVTS